MCAIAIRPGLHVRTLRLKLDENLSPQAAEVLRSRGYDAHTVPEEGLGGSADPRIGVLCRREGRCLVSLDLHFANPFAYPPAATAGIVVLRHPRPRLAAILRLVEELAAELQQRDPAGQLWIVEPGRVRIWSEATPEP